jgi:hypothetical protein
VELSLFVEEGLVADCAVPLPLDAAELAVWEIGRV